MIICKDGCYAYCGETASEAYEKYVSASDDHNQLPPEKLNWFSATKMNLKMSLEPKGKGGK